MATLAVRNQKCVVGVGSKVFAYHLNTIKDGLDLVPTGSLDISALSRSIPLINIENKDESDDCTIWSASFSNDGNMLAVATSAKTVLLFGCPNIPPPLVFSRGFRIPKAPTKVIFDFEDEYVVVADRAGTVRRYSVEGKYQKRCSDRQEDAEDSRFEGEFLCSAISMFLDIAFHPHTKLLFVADRDEKLRVYRYPQSFVLEKLLLGHKDYISSISIVSTEEYNIIFSAGGDGVLIAWDADEGRELGRSLALHGEGIRSIASLKKKVMSEEEDVFVGVLKEGEIGAFCLFSFQQNTFLQEGATETLGCAAFSLLSLPSTKQFMLLTREGLRMVKDGSWTMAGGHHHSEVIELLSLLRDVKDALPHLAKKTTAFDNVADYHRRKSIKLEQKRRKTAENAEKQAKKLKQISENLIAERQ